MTCSGGDEKREESQQRVRNGFHSRTIGAAHAFQVLQLVDLAATVLGSRLRILRPLRAALSARPSGP